MVEVTGRPATALGALACVAAGLLVGALIFGDSSSAQSPLGSGVAIEPVVFQSDREVSDRSILELGGLTLRASCHDYGRGQRYLGVTAETAVDDAVAAVSFGQTKGGGPASYTFVQSDFDRSYGRWDILGTNPDNTAGSLNLARPDGGQVLVEFVADEGTAQADCLFGGMATYAPAPPGSPASPPGAGSAPKSADPPEPGLAADPNDSFAVTDVYLGVTCPTSNSVACDRVGLFVSTEDKPDYIVAMIAGNEFRLESPGWTREGSAASFEGFLQVPGLLHGGPLAGAATADERWLGAPPVETPVRLQAVYRDRGTYGEKLMPDVPLAAGYG